MIALRLTWADRCERSIRRLGHHEWVLDRFVLEVNDFRKPQVQQELHIESFFDGCLELQKGDPLAAAQVDHAKHP